MSPTLIFSQNQQYIQMKTIAEKIVFGPIADQVRYRAVTEEHIQTLEEELLFEIPLELKNFYKEKGSFHFWNHEVEEEDKNYVISAQLFKVDLYYNVHEFHLHDFLSACIGDVEALGEHFLEEKELLNACYAVYASIDEVIEEKRFMEYFYFDALGNYGSLRFENKEGVNLSSLIDGLISKKEGFQTFMSSRLEKKAEVAALEEEEEEQEDKEKTDYLSKHKLKSVNYEEVLELLEVEQLFGYHDLYGEGGEGEFVDEIYVDDEVYIFYADQDVHISGDFKIPETWGGDQILIVVDGNLTVEGKMNYSYYVTGEATFDFLYMNVRQHTGGKEQVKYIQAELAEDHEMIHSGKSRKITAPYFFSWFYDLEAYTYSPETRIYGLYDWSKQKHFNTSNPYSIWQEPLFLLNPELVWSLEYRNSDQFSVDIFKMYRFLKEGKEVFIEGFDVNCLPLFRKGKELLKEEDYESAFLHFKKVIELSPKFYLGYLFAANCLKKVGAYAQAKTYDEKGIPLLPSKVKYPDFDCAEGAALSAIRLKEYEEALAISNLILDRNNQNYYALRLKAEVLIASENLKEAKSLLEKSVAINSSFTNYWLLGLIYFKENDLEKAEQYYQVAKRNNQKAEPYSQQQNLDYIYGPNKTVDWEQKKLEDIPSVEKDQSYWSDYFNRKIKTVSEYMWDEEVILNIPEEYRSRTMLETILNHESAEAKLIKYFPKLMDKSLAMKAISAEHPCSISDLPVELIDKEICMGLKSNMQLAEVPKEIMDYELCYKFVLYNSANLREVPHAFRDEKMKIAAVVGGGLRDYSRVKLSEKYYTDKVIFQAIDISMKTVKNLPPRYVNKAIYNYAASKYGATGEWKELVSQYDRNAYKKEGLEEFDYNTFDRVWACFWDEEFILNAINVDGEGERIYKLPKQYLTPKIVKAAVLKDPYDFPAVPSNLMTPELCELACSQDDGSFEFVPVSMRNETLCKIAVDKSGANLAFVPEEFKTTELCIRSVLDKSKNLRFIPYALYTDVFSKLLKQNSNFFLLGYIYRGRGIGAFYEERYEAAIKDFQKVLALDEEESRVEYKQNCLYYEGWINHKLGKFQEAEALYKKAMAYGQDPKFLTEAYESATLPTVISTVVNLNKYEFEFTMNQVKIHIDNKDFEEALQQLEVAEKMLLNAQSSNQSLWAIVWDHQRYALYETGQKAAAYSLCEKSIATLSEVQLWDYLEEFNPIRHTLRVMHNMLAYRDYENAEYFSDIQKGLKHAKLVFSTISPIEDETNLYPFYETKALLLQKASTYDQKYNKELDRLLKKIKKLRLREDGFLSDTFEEVFGF